ncbi:MAG: hypothetical protein BMS9Abin29_1160 [Gemmatimonadota bacterium]|nr:MAG: hypothetical protein BMS9Abin29_1160 [Gemmatimonadota bacterium]
MDTESLVDVEEQDKGLLRRFKGVVSRGVMAGILGATAMAFWFLIIDGSQGAPFRTPAFLAGALTGAPDLTPSLGPILLYSAIHYAAFVVVGLAISWFIKNIYTAPNILLGLVLGFAMFDFVFYLSVTATGVDVVAALGWPSVLAGNLIAGVTMMGFLHLTGATPPMSWWEILQGNRILKEGVMSGLLGAGVVALWFWIIDLVQGQPFFTPGALGSALFFGSTDLDAVTVSAVTVIGYTAVHITAFITTGIIAAAIACYAEDTPPLVLAAVLLFVTFEALFMGLMALLAEFLLGDLAWWSIALGNLLATVSMGYYLWVKHPKLQAVLEADPLDVTD